MKVVVEYREETKAGGNTLAPAGWFYTAYETAITSTISGPYASEQDAEDAAAKAYPEGDVVTSE